MSLLPIQQNISLAKYTTLKVGGNAEYFVEVTSEKELDEALGYAHENDLKATFLGGGSNVLVADAGVCGLTIYMRLVGIQTEVKNDAVYVTAYAGEKLDDLVQYAVTHGYWGIENLSHIPGSVGATPVQNVGAYGVEVASVIESVRVYNTADRKFEVLSVAECQLGYRDSIFKKEEGRKYIVVSVTYKLSTVPESVLSYKDLAERFSGNDSPQITEIREAVIDIRSKKFPDWNEVGTAGSFFKNPIVTPEKFSELTEQYPDMPSYILADGRVKIPLGWVLDKVLGLKGEGVGNVGQYQQQALVLINKGDATASEIYEYAQSVIQKVYEKITVEVEWEVTKIGF